MLDLGGAVDATSLNSEELQRHIAGLPCFGGKVDIRPLIGGLCNTNFVVSDAAGKYVVRIGGDIWVHGITQASVQNAMRAASRLGVTPRLVHAEPGLVVSSFIDGRALAAADIGDESIMNGWVARLRELHAGGRAVSGALSHFPAFQICRHYLRYCREHDSPELGRLAAYDEVVDRLEARVGPYVPLFTHNDVVPQNTMVDTDGRVHLVDWDYGGFGNPWFDVAGLATNTDATPEQEARILELYAGEVNDALRERLRLFKVAVNLREYLWGLVQDLSSALDQEIVSAGMATLYPDEAPGYGGYADMNLRRLEASLEDYRRHHP